MKNYRAIHIKHIHIREDANNINQTIVSEQPTVLFPTKLDQNVYVNMPIDPGFLNL